MGGVIGVVGGVVGGVIGLRGEEPPPSIGKIGGGTIPPKPGVSTDEATGNGSAIGSAIG